MSLAKIRKPLRAPGMGKPTLTRNPKARMRDRFSRSKIVTVGSISFLFLLSPTYDLDLGGMETVSSHQTFGFMDEAQALSYTVGH